MKQLAIIILLVTAAGADPKKPAKPAPPVRTSSTTGFDLSIDPAEETVHWKLDGQPRSEALPAKLRMIKPGKHVIEIEAPAPYLDVKRTFQVTYGKAEKIEIKLLESA